MSAYSPKYVAECFACDEGIMVGQRPGAVSCGKCENAFPASLNDDKMRVEVIALQHGTELDLSRFASLDDVVDTVMQTSGMAVLNLTETGSLYYQLKDGDQCPVRGCNGSLRETGVSSRHSATTQKSCNTCDFETFEKDVS